MELTGLEPLVPDDPAWYGRDGPRPAAAGTRPNKID